MEKSVLDQVKEAIHLQAEITARAFDNVHPQTTYQESKTIKQLGHATIEVFIKVSTK